MKVTLLQAKERIAKHLNLCPTDSRVTEYINEAQRRLIESGKWKNTYGKFTICATNGCITWPRQIETIESVAVSGAVGSVRNQWFEFLESGYGLLDSSDNVGVQIMDRGEAPVHRDMTGEGLRLRVYAFTEADVGRKITIKGYDQYGNWIRTIKSGSGADAIYQDGETITMINGSVDTIKAFTSITGIQKDVTEGNVQLYEVVNIAPLELIDLATYQPDETIPSYRRSLIPSLAGAAQCDENGTTPVTVIAKLRFIEAVSDTDVLLIDDLYAIKNMSVAIKMEENRDFSTAAEYRSLALDSLRNQLSNYNGDGVVPVIKLTSLDTHGGGGIESVI